MTQRYLVLCTGNRCRSQMAHGWLQHLAPTPGSPGSPGSPESSSENTEGTSGGSGGVEVFSAGTRPQGVHPLSIRVMAEAGVDIAHHTSDHVDQYASQHFDAVITVCDHAKEACPVFSNANRTIHHAFPDPDDKTGTKTDEELLHVFRGVRDEIRAWCAAFLASQI